MKETSFELGLAWTGMVLVLIVGSTYCIESSSPGEAKKRGILRKEIFLLQNERKKRV